MKLNKTSILYALLFGLGVLACINMNAQMIPSKEENIDYLVSFGKNADINWGDDDKIQIYFFSVSRENSAPIYIRIFDPDVGGAIDQINNSVFDTKCSFSLYGGPQSYSHKDARGVNPVGNFRSGIRLSSVTFGKDSEYDGKWYTIGPINPQEGEFDKEMDAYVFKLIIEGLSGDDGNLYRLFLSSSGTNNVKVEGGNAFTYEMTFCLKREKQSVAHFYPYVKSNLEAIKIHTFDYDHDGFIRLYSVAKLFRNLNGSGDGTWAENTQTVVEKEHNTSYDYQIVSSSKFNNDMTIYFTNKYNKAIPFFSNPIGGVPKYKYKVDVNYSFK
ncbi:MAG: hypothetical protein JKY48_20275 [Flavobacteriales bacterium]|nr:hypothetical protein [Flavobacteriales bacterium]